MAITKEQAIDILEKFDFFQGQRAGRELWNDKPFEVQEQDIKDFSNDVALLKQYIADVVPKSEVERLTVELDAMRGAANSYKMHYENIARKIFEEIEKALSDNFHADCQMGDCIEDYYDDNLRDEIAELKKKYTGQKQCPNCRYFVGCEKAIWTGVCDEYAEVKNDK